ncbi:MAG: response regulator, partial [Pseudoxanthomonas sp.]|nr:response regulator [Pseudoxanthomonas sp.]
MTARPTVLLCDDSRALRMLAAGQLEEAGFQVAGEAGNGLDAVAQYQALKPDLVLLDLVMPECDGRQALARILDADPTARVVILSSLGARSDIEECLRLGARSYLQKPIDPEAMERVLRDALHRRQRRPGERMRLVQGQAPP